jgi:uncharacterized membrane protein
VYNRKVELQGVADAAALAAAAEFDGTAEGIDRAVTAAHLSLLIINLLPLGRRYAVALYPLVQTV